MTAHEREAVKWLRKFWSVKRPELCVNNNLCAVVSNLMKTSMMMMSESIAMDEAVVVAVDP